MGVLSEETRNKMQIEVNNGDYIDNLLGSFKHNMEPDLAMKVYGQIRDFRKKIFELKLQAKDLNAMYESINVSPLNKWRTVCNGINNVSDLLYLIHIYYSSMIDMFEYLTLKEKAERDSEQKEFDIEKEDVFELE